MLGNKTILMAVPSDERDTKIHEHNAMCKMIKSIHTLVMLGNKTEVSTNGHGNVNTTVTII
jgi:hypothetical protein